MPLQAQRLAASAASTVPRRATPDASESRLEEEKLEVWMHWGGRAPPRPESGCSSCPGRGAFQAEGSCLELDSFPRPQNVDKAGKANREGLGDGVLCALCASFAPFAVKSRPYYHCELAWQHLLSAAADPARGSDRALRPAGTAKCAHSHTPAPYASSPARHPDCQLRCRPGRPDDRRPRGGHRRP
jgi:hypothetical protein